eukprot:13351284-Ditylum_brightwellii.AAC.1
MHHFLSYYTCELPFLQRLYCVSPNAYKPRTNHILSNMSIQHTKVRCSKDINHVKVHVAQSLGISSLSTT